MSFISGSKPRIGLIGYFGWGNFGDELFVKAHKENLSDVFDMEVVHDILADPYFTSKKLDDLEKYDAFLIGGGDLLSPSIVSQLYWRKEYLKKPVFVYGVGVPEPRRRSSKAINYYKEFFQSDSVVYTAFRDKDSCDYFNYIVKPKKRAVYFSDPVLSLRLPKPYKFKEKTIGFCIRDHRSLKGDYNNVLIAADSAREKGYAVKFIVLGNGAIGWSDFKKTVDLVGSSEDLVYSEDLSEICSVIGGLDLLVSVKFHGLVVASMYFVPCIQMLDTPKSRNFLNYLERDDLVSDYQSSDLFLRIPYYPTSIHSLLIKKMIKNSKDGYRELKNMMCKTLGVEQ